MTDNRYSMKNTGRRIQQIRKANELTQERLVEFAAEFNISLDY